MPIGPSCGFGAAVNVTFLKKCRVFFWQRCDRVKRNKSSFRESEQRYYSSTPHDMISTLLREMDHFSLPLLCPMPTHQSFSLSWKCHQHTVRHPTALDLPTFYYVFVDISPDSPILKTTRNSSKRRLENESKCFSLMSQQHLSLIWMGNRGSC